MPTAPGVKLDDGKPDVFTLLLSYFPRALYEVTKVSTYGANKYCVAGWESVDNGYSRYSGALVRHIFDGIGEDNDWESGLLHDAHTAWNALARLELKLREQENEARAGGNAGVFERGRNGDNMDTSSNKETRRQLELCFDSIESGNIDLREAPSPMVSRA